MNSKEIIIEKLDEILVIHTENPPRYAATINLQTINRNNLKRWINALRSGEYKQANRQLYDWKNESYCCLGVFCRINTNDLDGFDRSVKFLTENQQKPMCEYNLELQKIFAVLNDVYMMNFNRIADIIETMLSVAASEHNTCEIIKLDV